VGSDLPQIPVTNPLPDQTFCQTNFPIQGSLALSPPYTPYSQDPASIQDHTHYNHAQPFTDMNLLDEIELLPSSDLNGFSFSGDFSDLSASYKQGGGGGGGGFVGDASIPAFNQIPPITSCYSVPPAGGSTKPSSLSFSSADTVFASTPDSATGNPLLLAPTNQILSMTGHVTHYCSQSSTPSPPLESHFVSLATQTSREPSMGGLPSSKGAFMADVPFQQGSTYSSTFSAYNSPNASHQVKQNVVSETRTRYGGMTPIHTSGAVGGSHHKEVGPMRGRAPRPGMPQEVGEWSQWHKNGPLEPVC